MNDSKSSTVVQSKSMEILTKILATLSTFVLFMLVSAWHLTKKRYCLVPIEAAEKVGRAPAGLKELAKRGTGLGPLPRAVRLREGRVAVFVGDLSWCLRHRASFVFTIQYAVAPVRLRRAWTGVLFNVDSTESSVLKCLVLKAFETLDWRVLLKADEEAGMVERTHNSNGARQDAQAWTLAFETCLGFAAAAADGASMTEKDAFANRVRKLGMRFEHNFMEGKDESNGESEEEEVHEAVVALLQQVVESTVYMHSKTDKESEEGENLLAQLALLRRQLAQETVDTSEQGLSNLTLDDFSCCVFEHYFVLASLARSVLLGIEYLLSTCPLLGLALARELQWESVSASNKSWRLSCARLEAEDRLVLCKASSQELLRLLAIGTEFDMYTAERDFQLQGYDVEDGSVLVFNHHAFVRDPVFHVLSSEDAALFRPARFISYNANNDQYRFYNCDNLAFFQENWPLFGVPRCFLCRLTLMTLCGAVARSQGRCLALVPRAEDQQEMQQSRQYELIHDLQTCFPWHMPFSPLIPNP